MVGECGKIWFMSAEIQKNGYCDTQEDLHDPEDKDFGGGFDGMDIYHNEINRIKLLTGEEETALSQKIQAGQEALRILSQKATDSFSQEEVDELNRTIEEGRKARERFIVSNLKLARARAKAYVGRGLDLDDLVQEANIGLTRAVDRFDWTKGYKFSTYAYWWINQGMTRALADQGNLVRIPVYMQDLRLRIWKHKNNFFKLYGKDPTDEELVLMTGIDSEELARARNSYIYVRYLSESVGDDSEEAEELGELLPSNLLDPGRQAEEELDLERKREAIIQAFSSLSPQEQDVVKLRFGLEEESSDRQRTLEEVGEEIGKTRERVRQIEYKAISKLRSNRRLRAIVKT